MKSIILNTLFFLCSISVYAQNRSLSIVAYNIQMLPKVFGFSDTNKNQGDRINYIHISLSNYEVAIVSEAFDDEMRNILIKNMKATHPYNTCILGHGNDCNEGDKSACQDGGVIIFSKYPIIEQDQIQYYETDCEVNIFDTARPECWGHDCQSRKGAVYAKIKKEDLIFNIFGTHTQAGNDKKKYSEARTLQFLKLNSFVNSRRIPSKEPIIIAGDLNVDMINGFGEYKDMISLLNTVPITSSGHKFTSDPSNCLVRDNEKGQYLDYILFRKNHLLATNPIVSTVILKTPKSYQAFQRLDPKTGQAIFIECNDLSDHYAVACIAEFSSFIDRDEDDVEDKDDVCPDKAGFKKWKGCPDSDNDGVGDNTDRCVNIKGIGNCGCPDCDEDGIDDEVDECPNKKGVAKYLGCPTKKALRDAIMDYNENNIPNRTKAIQIEDAINNKN